MQFADSGKCPFFFDGSRYLRNRWSAVGIEAVKRQGNSLRASRLGQFLSTPFEQGDAMRLLGIWTAVLVLAAIVTAAGCSSSNIKPETGKMDDEMKADGNMMGGDAMKSDNMMSGEKMMTDDKMKSDKMMSGENKMMSGEKK